MTDSRLSLRESTCPQSKPTGLAGSPTVLAAILALLCSLPPACLAQPAVESLSLRSLSGRTMEFNGDGMKQVTQGYGLVPYYTDEEMVYIFSLLDGVRMPGASCGSP